MMCSRLILSVAAAGLLASCEQPEPVDPVGRYTIIYGPHVQRSTMLIDTQTGRTWNLVTTGDDENAGYAWEPVPKD